VPLGCGPCVRRTGHPFAASGPQGPSQKIELVFTASLETVSGEPKEICDFRRSLGQGGTWQSARFRILRFSFRCGFVFYAAMPASPRIGSKSRCSRSTTMRYATSLRATASVAQLAFPFCRAFSYTKARSGFRLGANFAASTRTRWICLFRCVSTSTEHGVEQGNCPQASVGMGSSFVAVFKSSGWSRLQPSRMPAATASASC